MLPDLDVNANELALVYRARGMEEGEATKHAARVISRIHAKGAPLTGPVSAIDDHEAIGTGWGAALSSFCFFASGAIIPVLPYIFGLQGIVAVAVAVVLVGIALLVTGAVVGLLSGAPPLRRALRQLGIGLGAAAVTYVLGLAFGTTIG